MHGKKINAQKPTPIACAFCVFYAGKKDCGCTPLNKPKTTEINTDVACFENIYFAEDTICILRDFD